MLEVRHLVAPGYVQAVTPVDEGETVAAFLERAEWKFKLPTICVVNGQPLMRAEWDELVITSETHVVFLSRPFGGSGGGTNSTLKTVVGIVALIAVVAFAYWATPLILGSALSSTAIVGSLTVGSVVTGAIILGGSLLISTLLRPKAGGQTDPNSQTSSTVGGSAGDQLYSLSATNNSGRLLGPLPIGYGRIRWTPDYADTPWSEYIGEDEYLNILLVLSAGVCALEKIFIDDIVFWDFSLSGVQPPFTDATVAVYLPTQPVTLFPVNVYTSPDVSAIELLDPGVQQFAGPFPASSPGTTSTSIAVDIALPQGLYLVDATTGAFSNASVGIIVEYQEINDAGTPIGSWLIPVNGAIVMNTRTPQRLTYKFPTVEGRYQVRVGRLEAPITDTSGVNSAAWLGMRAFLVGPSVFDDVTVLAIRMKATNQLSSNGARKFGVLIERWVDNVGDGISLGFSQNPIFCFLDAATNTTYGAGRPYSKIDMATLLAEAANCDSRGDVFNYVFTSVSTVPQALDKILAPARLKHRWAGDILTVVRDEWKPIPQMLLTDAQIVRGSLSIDYVFNDDESSDSVVVEYLDETIWGPAEVQYPPNGGGFTSVSPTRIRLDGITSRDHATREAGFWYLQAQYRRIFVTLDTEHDGKILQMLAPVRIQSELPQSWGQTGDVLSFDGTNILIVDPPPNWAGGQKYINIRTRVGGSWGPCKVSQGIDTEHIVVDLTDAGAVEIALGISLTQALGRTDDSELPSFDFGIAGSYSRQAIVLSGRPQGDKVTLQLVLDDIRVHSSDLDGVPGIPAQPQTVPPTVPTILGLIADFKQGVAEPILEASWWRTKSADTYSADVSYDLGVSWTHLYDGTSSSFSTVVNRSALKLRVQGIGRNLPGPFATLTISAPNIVIAPDTVNTQSFLNELRDYVTTQFQNTKILIDQWQQTIGAAAVEQEAANWLDKFNTKKTAFTNNANLQGQITTLSTSVTASFGEAFADIETNQTAITDLTGAFASYQVTVDARFGVNEGNITSNQTAIADVTGSFADYRTVVDAKIGGGSGPAILCTMTAFLGGAIFNHVAHGLVANQAMEVDGVPGTWYVVAGPTADAFQLSATVGGAAGSTATFSRLNYTLHTYAVGTMEATVTTSATTIATHSSSLASLNANVTSRVGAVAVGKNFTMTGTNPVIFNSTAHGLIANDKVLLETTGALMVGIAVDVEYFVIAAGLTSGQFELSATLGGAALTVASATNSGIHTFYKVLTGSLQASVTTNATTIANVNGKLLATYQINLNVNGYVSGVQAYNDGTTSAFIISADVFEVAWPGVTGGSPVPMFQVASVGGVTKVALRGDVLADGSISARNLVTGSAVITGSAQIGDLVVNSINIADQAVTVPAAASRLDSIVGIGFPTFIADTITCSISIVGIVGKPLTVFTICKYGVIYGLAGSEEGQLQLNTTPVDSAGGGSGATNTLMFTNTVTATGTTQTFASSLYWRADALNTLTQRSIFMMGAKR